MKYLFFTFLSLSFCSSFGQCNGSSQWPSQTLNAPNWLNDTIYSVGIYAGEYSQFNDFKPSFNYIISSDSLQEDYLTVANLPSSTDPGYSVLASGVPPIAFVPTNDGSYYIHVNLAVGCGSEDMPRKMSVVCTDCPLAKSVGIGTEDPENSAVLDIVSTSQGLSIPSHTNISRDGIGDPVDGLLIYNTQEKVIESYDGGVDNWVSYRSNTVDPFPNSTLLDQDDKELLNKWAGKENQKWQLCYQRSEDGASASSFHTNCNNRGPTITIIKLSNNRIFGGFITAGWSNSTGYSNSQNAFIFSIDNEKRYPVSSPGNASYNKSDYGPTFGGGHDIYVNSFISTLYVNFPHGYAYEGSSGSASSVATQELCGLNPNVNGTIVELEVWYFDY